MERESILRYTILNSIKKEFKLNSFRRKWYRKHRDSNLIPMSCFPENIVEVGKASYGELNIVTFASNTKLIIGSYVSIAQKVTFLLDVEHHIDNLSTYPFKAKILGDSQPEAFSKGDIVIDDDVWIGYGATIMSGIHIGQGAVIAAGAVVTKNIPAYAIVGGTPAQIIKYRFNQDICNKLINFKFSKLEKENIMDNIETLYTPLRDWNGKNISNIKI